MECKLPAKLNPSEIAETKINAFTRIIHYNDCDSKAKACESNL